MKFIKLAICLLVLLSGAEPVQAQQKKEILVLHSYHEGMAWTDSIMEGITDVFEHKNIGTNIHVEYMDTKRHSPDDVFEFLHDFISSKYKNRDLDLILVSDDNAYKFMLDFGDRLFQKVPVVFCGVNNFDQSQLVNRENYTGIVENVAVLETLDTTLGLHPKTQQVYVVNDHTTTGRALKRIVQNAIPQLSKKLQFNFLESLTLAELQKQLEVLPPESLILLLSFNRDSSGQTFSYREAITQIAPHARSPMYGVWEFYLGRGIVGGKLTWGRAHGKAAALMGLSILQGVPAKAIPVRLENGGTYMYDYQQLKKYGISEQNLPVGSVVVNEPNTLFHKYKTFVFSALGAVLALSIFSATLVFNIIQRKKVEEKIRENARLKSEFITTAAHEFRTPLTSIQGYSELLLIQEEISKEERKKFLTYIHERSKYLAKVVADLLDIGRFESGQEIPMNMTMFSVSDLVEDLKLITADKGGEHRLEIMIEDSEIQLYADINKLFQVFENLISNANKYSPSDTKIRVEGRRGKEDKYLFSVIDHGIGMTPEQLEKMFDKFYRADASNKALEGLGLGMSIARQIIETHGGEIFVKSAMHSGTTVDFTIPMRSASGGLPALRRIPRATSDGEES